VTKYYILKFIGLFIFGIVSFGALRLRRDAVRKMPSFLRNLLPTFPGYIFYHADGSNRFYRNGMVSFY
jgi:hypothetical protein